MECHAPPPPPASSYLTYCKEPSVYVHEHFAKFTISKDLGDFHAWEIFIVQWYLINFVRWLFCPMKMWFFFNPDIFICLKLLWFTGLYSQE